jgi:hypothetical protein
MKILLIHNRFRWSDPVTWLSKLIRIVTNSRWNHVAIEHNGVVTEAIGAGVMSKSYSDWCNHSDRLVLPLEVEHDLEMLKRLLQCDGMGYGYMDLWQIFRYIQRTRWNGENYTWNGSTKIFKGYTCSELAAVVLGLEQPHLYMPCDFEHLPYQKGQIFETAKISGPQ